MNTAPGARHRARVALAAAASFAVAVSLAGCVPDAEVTTPSPTPVPTVSPSASAEPSAVPQETPEGDPTPFSADCASLVSLQAMYDFNPNFGLTGAFDPASGSVAATAASEQGTLCRWVNATSGDPLDITVSIPDPDVLVERRAAAASGTPIDGVPEAWYAMAGENGVAQAFTGEYWVTLSSVFLGPGDAAPILTEVLGALP